MIYSQKGEPWDFLTTYNVDSCLIEFREMCNFFKEGPLCGQLYVNGKLVDYPQCDGFGGPPLITKEYLYTPVYQRNLLGFKDIIGAFIAEIDLQSLSVRIIGKKQELIHIAYMDKGKLFFYDSCKDNQRNIKSVDINEGFIPYTFRDKMRYLYKFLKSL